MVGRGASAVVHQVQLCKSNNIVAVKSFDADHFGLAANELCVYRSLAATKNPFVVEFYGAEEDIHNIHLVLQFCAGGDLFRRFERLRQDRVELGAHILFYMAELVCALEHVHDHNIVVNDLKSENVGLDADGHIRLIDFGLSVLDATSLLYEMNGSEHCMPPEKVVGEGYGAPVDMFALGCLLYELCSGQRPLSYLTGRGGSKLDPDVLATMGDEYRDAIHRLTEENPNQRLTATQFKQHALFKGVDWNKVAARQVDAPWTPTRCEYHTLDPDAFDSSQVEKPDLSMFRYSRIKLTL